MNKNVLWALLAATMLSISPAFAAGSISITGVTIPTSVSQGDAFNIILSVSGSSVTGVSGSLTLPSGISCTPTGTQTISLGGSGSGSATWSCTASVSGDYSNRITAGVSATDSGTGGTLTDSKQTGLSVLSPASLTTSSVLSNSGIAAGGTATFTVGVNNVGDASTTFNISCSSSSGAATCTPSSVSTASISGKSLANNQFTITGVSAGTPTITATISSPVQSDISTSQTVTVTSSSSQNSTTPPASPGGGGGGDSSATATVSKTWVSLVAGGTGIMPISSASIDFTQLSFQASAALTNAKLTVEKLTSRPSSVSADPAGTIYQYVSIAKENMNDTQITATIEFRVDKTWMSKNSIDNSGITLNRYSGTSWTALQTTYVTSDANYTYFSAASPGFSYFAITGTKSAVAAQAPSGQTPGAVCAQVITPAKNTATGECKEFSTPCDVPAGWTKIDSCAAAAGNKTTTPATTGGGKTPAKTTYYIVGFLVILALAYYFLFMRGRGPKYSFDK